MDEILERKLVKGRVNDLYVKEEIKWRQKSMVKEVQEGNMNTNYLHKVASARNSLLSITS